jgi:hypothetical protein
VVDETSEPDKKMSIAELIRAKKATQSKDSPLTTQEREKDMI